MISCYPDQVKTLRQYTIESLGFFVFVLWLLGTTPALAAEGTHSAGLMVGQVWPSGDIGNGLDGNVAPGLFYEYAASEVFSLYSQIIPSSHNEGVLKLTATSVGMKAHLVYYDKLAPYVMVGAGLYFADREVGVARERAKKTVFGIHLGLGAELDLSEMFFIGLQFDIHSLFAGTVNLPVNGKTEISGRTAGFFLRGGVRF